MEVAKDLIASKRLKLVVIPFLQKESGVARELIAPERLTPADIAGVFHALQLYRQVSYR
jgi:hypothetical protein